MTDGRDIIRTLEQELEVTQEKCAVIERAITSMREIYGITGELDDVDEVAPPARRGRTPGPKPKKRRKGKKQASKQASKAKRVPVNGGPFDHATSALGTQIVATLKQHGGVMKPGELLAASKVHLEKYAYRALLMQLHDGGRLVRSGNGRGAMVALPGKSPARGSL